MEFCRLMDRRALHNTNAARIGFQPTPIITALRKWNQSAHLIFIPSNYTTAQGDPALDPGSPHRWQPVAHFHKPPVISVPSRLSRFFQHPILRPRPRSLSCPAFSFVSILGRPEFSYLSSSSTIHHSSSALPPFCQPSFSHFPSCFYSFCKLFLCTLHSLPLLAGLQRFRPHCMCLTRLESLFQVLQPEHSKVLIYRPWWGREDGRRAEKLFLQACWLSTELREAICSS